MRACVLALAPLDPGLETESLIRADPPRTVAPAQPYSPHRRASSACLARREFGIILESESYMIALQTATVLVRIHTHKFPVFIAAKMVADEFTRVTNWLLLLFVLMGPANPERHTRTGKRSSLASLRLDWDFDSSKTPEQRSSPNGTCNFGKRRKAEKPKVSASITGSRPNPTSQNSSQNFSDSKDIIEG
ncbi:putative effector protein [Blumeria hordei DH14]|uniref:Putative effector protein n=1 Tax=Blumeria graminis f. sp. hordei (strain DH14) TaxID=546991 RepID=N1J645_BLUG1|nr:putative effector protein [Blumeria hordei DH14]